jgi:hypothetical protein
MPPQARPADFCEALLLPEKRIGLETVVHQIGNAGTMSSPYLRATLGSRKVFTALHVMIAPVGWHAAEVAARLSQVGLTPRAGSHWTEAVTITSRRTGRPQ